MALAAALFVIALGEDPRPEPRPIPDNHTATVLVERAPALGVDFGPVTADRALRSRPSEAGAWLEEQLKVPDDSIGKPPAELDQFLEDHRDALDAIVGALETAPPEWKDLPSDEHPVPDLLPSLRLHRVLLASALVAARRGDSLEAERFLEASWSLSRPNESSPQLIRQLIGIAAGRWQAGVLRKLPSVSPMWISRLSEARSWEGAFEAWEYEVRPRKSDAGLPTSDPWDEFFVKTRTVLLAGLRKLGPCDCINLSDDAVWKMVERELPITTDEVVLQNRKILYDIMMPNLKNALDRAGRLAVDRELTLEILRLRQAKEQDPEKRWPESAGNLISTVCPSFSYVYRSDDAGMEIRFDGTLADPPVGMILPLTFGSAYPKKEATPTPTVDAPKAP